MSSISIDVEKKDIHIGEVPPPQRSSGSGVALVSSRSREIDAFQDQHQVGRRDLHALACSVRKVEPSPLEALAPKAHPGPVPVKHLQHVPDAVSETKQMARERLVTEVVTNQTGEPVERHAEIRGPHRQEDLDRRGKSDHGTASRTETTRESRP